MAIPGSKPQLDIHAKVRIGETRKSQGGKTYPAALDYFVSESPDFAELTGAKPKKLAIRFVHDTIEDAFSTGLEWWIKDKNKNPLLACYTKDGGANPVALRMEGMLDKGQAPLDDQVTKGGRVRISCPARSCPHFQKHGNKPADCRPMGRLVFVIDGDPLSRVWELDTKAWSSIEALTGTLRLAQTQGPLAGRLFELSVRMEKKGSDRFPVLSIREESDVPVAINDKKGVSVAEATIALGNSEKTKRDLAAYLDVARPDWRDNENYVKRIQEVGYEQAIKTILDAGA